MADFEDIEVRSQLAILKIDTAAAVMEYWFEPRLGQRHLSHSPEGFNVGIVGGWECKEDIHFYIGLPIGV